MHRRGLQLERRLWIATFVVLLLWPLLLLVVEEKPGSRSIGTIVAAAFGFVALTALVLQIATVSRSRRLGTVLGVGVLLRLHRAVGIGIVALALLHVVVLMLDDPGRLELLNSITAPHRARAAAVSLLAILALAVTTMFRARLGLRYERWRSWHLALAAGAILFGFAHAVLVRAYTTEDAVRWLLTAFVWGGALAFFLLRVGRPYERHARRYRLVEVRPERGNASTLVLEAVGHHGDLFRPGQFAWLKLADRPFSLVEHPVSYSSSACAPASPCFTFRAVGDFTRAVAELAPGTELIVDGPHGSYEPQLPDAGFVLIAAGTGVTPSMSILRTLRDQGDERPVQLIYGSRNWDDVCFREELAELQARGLVDVVHVLSNETDDAWPGERGRIGGELLTRVLAPDAHARNVFLCGPPAMVDAAIDALRDLGLPPHHVHAESFAFA